MYSTIHSRFWSLTPPKPGVGVTVCATTVHEVQQWGDADTVFSLSLKGLLVNMVVHAQRELQ